MAIFTEVDEAWNYLIDNDIASEEALRLITNINGYNMETMEDVLFCQTGERSFNDDEDEDEE